MEPENTLLRLRLFIWACVCVYILRWSERRAVTRCVTSERWTERMRRPTDGPETERERERERHVWDPDGGRYLLRPAGVLWHHRKHSGHQCGEKEPSNTNNTIHVFISVHLSVLADTFIQWDSVQSKHTLFLAFPGTRTRDLGTWSSLTSITNDVKNDTEESFS